MITAVYGNILPYQQETCERAGQFVVTYGCCNLEVIQQPLAAAERKPSDRLHQHAALTNITPPPKTHTRTQPPTTNPDGFGGGWGRAQIMRIMQDSRIGTYALVGVALLLQIKIGAIATLASEWRASGTFSFLAALWVLRFRSGKARSQRLRASCAIPPPPLPPPPAPRTPHPEGMLHTPSPQTPRRCWLWRTAARAGRRCRCCSGPSTCRMRTLQRGPW